MATNKQHEPTDPQYHKQIFVTDWQAKDVSDARARIRCQDRLIAGLQSERDQLELELAHAKRLIERYERALHTIGTEQGNLLNAAFVALDALGELP